MTALHVAANGPLTRALLADVLAEFDLWAEFAPRQAAGIATDSEEAAFLALQDVRNELMDHVKIRFAITLATFGLTA